MELAKLPTHETAGTRHQENVEEETFVEKLVAMTIHEHKIRTRKTRVAASP